MQQLIFVLVIITVFTIKGSSTNNCYACESLYDSKCGENFKLSAHFKADCTAIKPPRFLQSELTNLNSTGCYKRTFKENGVLRIERNCFYGDVNETYACNTDPMAGDYDDLQCFMCESDYCNEAITISIKHEWPRKLALVFFVLIAKLLNHKLS